MILSALSLNKKKDTEKENKYKADIKKWRNNKFEHKWYWWGKAWYLSAEKNKIFLVKK